MLSTPMPNSCTLLTVVLFKMEPALMMKRVAQLGVHEPGGQKIAHMHESNHSEG